MTSMQGSPPIKPPHEIRIGILIGWLGVVGVAYLMWNEMAIDTRPPVQMISTEALNSPVRPGEDLEVRIYREKVRDCPIVSYRYLTNWEGRRIDLPAVPVAVGGPVGEPYVDWSYPIPEDLPVGGYELHVELVYECQDGNHFVVQPPTKFRVTR